MSGEDRDIVVEPRRSLPRRIVLIIATGLAVIALLLASLCHFLGIHSRMDVIAYQAMWREPYHPIWKDLALRRIRKGDDVDELLEEHPLVQMDRFEPYMHLSYHTRGMTPPLHIVAKDGRLIHAHCKGHRWSGDKWSRSWSYTFFGTPTDLSAFSHANRKHREQVQLEENAYKIHRAITLGQDLFLSDHVERREVPDTSPTAKEMMAQLKAIYGDRYVQSTHLMQEGLAVEVKEVLYGDLEPGTILTFRENPRISNGNDAVFLHFEDAREIFPHAKDESVSLILPKRALDWYRSLTDDQIKAFEARCLARGAKERRVPGRGE